MRPATGGWCWTGAGSANTNLLFAGMFDSRCAHTGPSGHTASPHGCWGAYMSETPGMLAPCYPRVPPLFREQRP